MLVRIKLNGNGRRVAFAFAFVRSVENGMDTIVLRLYIYTRIYDAFVCV